MPDQPALIRVRPVTLRKGDRLLTDPDDPNRTVDWTITSDPRMTCGIPVVDYVTGDGTEGTHGFEPPQVWLMVQPAPPTAGSKQAGDVGAARAVA